MSGIFGFTIIRNGQKYDYPFMESLQSLLSVCDEVYVAVGDSADATLEMVQNLPRIHVVQTVWDEQLRKGGEILSQQTNLILKHLRKDHPQGFGVYLQADEIFLDPQSVRKEISAAMNGGFDSIRFRYAHFWQRPDQIAIGKKWYPAEIRAIRLGTEIVSYGDAQSFRNCTKVMESDQLVFHYGHVRRPEAYELKKKDFHRWWHADSEIQKVLSQSKKKDSEEVVIPYLGPHPETMVQRNEAWNLESFYSFPRKLWVQAAGTRLQDPELQNVLKGVYQTEVICSESRPVGFTVGKDVHFRPFCPKLLRFFLEGKSTRIQMRRKDARPWPKFFEYILRLSLLGVRTNKFSF